MKKRLIMTSIALSLAGGFLVFGNGSGDPLAEAGLQSCPHTCCADGPEDCQPKCCDDSEMCCE